MMLAAAFAVLTLSGCGSSDNYYNDGATTLFLVDERGDAVAGVPYSCFDGRVLTYEGYTLPNGEFTFYPGQDCWFDFYGYNGTDPLDGFENDYMYIVDLYDNGKNDIPYECELFNVGYVNYTYDDGIWDGAFDYDYDDRCVFYL